jgi:hypothetical protein
VCGPVLLNRCLLVSTRFVCVCVCVCVFFALLDFLWGVKKLSVTHTKDKKCTKVSKEKCLKLPYLDNRVPAGCQNITIFF